MSISLQPAAHMALAMAIAACCALPAAAQVMRCTDPATGQVTYTDGGCHRGDAVREVQERQSPQDIARERQQLADVRERADVVIDTSDLTVWDLRRKVSETLLGSGGKPRLQVQFVSFGYKHGTPREADLLFDVRFLQNPHYVPELRGLTGLDDAVSAFVAAAPGMDEFRERLEALLDFLLPAYRDEGKTGLVIGIGCTGGRHRSVAIAEELAAHYSGGDFDVSVAHRHISKATGPPPEPGA